MKICAAVFGAIGFAVIAFEYESLLCGIASALFCFGSWNLIDA